MKRSQFTQMELPLDEPLSNDSKPWSLRMEVLRIRLGFEPERMSRVLGISLSYYQHVVRGYRMPSHPVRRVVLLLELTEGALLSTVSKMEQTQLPLALR